MIDHRAGARSYNVLIGIFTVLIGVCLASALFFFGGRSNGNWGFLALACVHLPLSAFFYFSGKLKIRGIIFLFILNLLSLAAAVLVASVLDRPEILGSMPAISGAAGGLVGLLVSWLGLVSMGPSFRNISLSALLTALCHVLAAGYLGSGILTLSIKSPALPEAVLAIQIALPLSWMLYGCWLLFMFRDHVPKGSSIARTDAPYVEPPPPSGSVDGAPLETLSRLAELHRAGVLTDAEFEAKKRELLGRL